MRDRGQRRVDMLADVDGEIRVTGGTPTAEEVAALVGVLLLRRRTGAAPVRPAVSRWRRSGLPAAGPRPGPGAWRAAALPR